MPLLNRNKRIACLECGREYTLKDASRHRKHSDVLKCSNYNFYRFSSEELTNHIKKKQCQYNVKVCAPQSQKTHQERYIFKKNKVENTLNNNFLLSLKSLYTIFEKFLVKNLQFFVIILVLSYSKVLIDGKTSNNRVQFVVKLSTEINPKIFNLQ